MKDHPESVGDFLRVLEEVHRDVLACKPYIPYPVSAHKLVITYIETLHAVRALAANEKTA